MRPADVAQEADFDLGQLRVSPSARRVEAGGEAVTVEPRVMQTLLLLSRQRNQVVTRDHLFDEIWGGAMVGDDSLNRAVAGVRKIVAMDPQTLSLETIPRTGYRLNVAGEGGTRDAGRMAPPSAVSRRVALGGAAALAALAGGSWWYLRSKDEDQFQALIDESLKALSYGDPSVNPAASLKRAVALRPDDAAAQGLLAYALALLSFNQQRGGTALVEANRAANAALVIDPSEPNARLAHIFVHQTTLDLFDTEERLEAILKTAPDNRWAMRHYWNLLQCVGRSREALAMVQRAMKVDPISAQIHYPLAQLLWINGRVAEADRIIDQATQYWPEHRFIRFARFNLLAFTDRAPAARAMLDGRGTAPQAFSAQGIELWRVSLDALNKRTPDAIAAAVRANVEMTKADLSLTNQAVMVLSDLGYIDEAFELVNALFVVPDGRSAPAPAPQAADSMAWRFAPWLFVPPTAPLRKDPRFAVLCDSIGLTAYWRRRNVRPDYQLA